MKIVVNNIAASTGGAMTILREFYDYIKVNETEHEWIFLLGDNYLEETEKIRVIILQKIKNSRINKLKFDFITGKDLIEKINPDVVFSMQNIITFGLKIPQAVYIHQSIPFQDIKNFSLLKSTERNLASYQHIIGKIIILSAKKANKVIVQTKWMKKAVSEKAKISEKKIVNVLPNIDAMNICKKEGKHKRNQFFYPTTDNIYKNNECIYEACKILNSKGVFDFNVKLTIEKKNNFDYNIEFVGMIPREQVIDEYNYSTLVFPSYIETFGYPMAEARQMGTIILASDCPFSREVLEGYENAYFFDPFNPEELAELMKQVILGNLTVPQSQAFEGQPLSQDNNWRLVVKEVIGI